MLHRGTQFHLSYIEGCNDVKYKEIGKVCGLHRMGTTLYSYPHITAPVHDSYESANTELNR